MQSYLRKIKSKISSLKLKSRLIKREVAALYIACRRRDVPISAKIISFLVVGYALSPIDLIPDFIPILGLLDDIIIVPFGIKLAIKLIPKNIMDECRLHSDDFFEKHKHRNWIAAIIIILTWLLIILFILKLIFRF